MGRRTKPASRRPERTAPGVGVDAGGGPLIDPTKNVLDLVAAMARRQDDLRDVGERHQREVSTLRADHTREMRQAEAERINAIRAVDVAAVQQAAQVSAQQAMTLAAQVAASAETLRTQVAAAATAATVALAAALEPIQKDIADLRKTQYEQAGGKAQVGETRDARGDARLNLNTVIIAMGLIIAAVTLVIGLRK